MSAAAAAAVKAAILALTDENTRKKIGWVLAAILSPVILLIAFCALWVRVPPATTSPLWSCAFTAARSRLRP